MRSDHFIETSVCASSVTNDTHHWDGFGLTPQNGRLGELLKLLNLDSGDA